ncbi:FY-rich [Trypanosoma melophagium]|uniref:FY-rich n=1 Tax=Trypanosoma melophagium TaxID=715481 RepID=UPI00351A5BAF|nr:FY-rich [Trypanosoma melophagium]
MLRVVSFGALATDPRFFRQNAKGTLPYPIGYTIERSVFNNSGGNGRNPRTKILLPGEEGASEHLSELYYTASIRKGQNGEPLFEVKRSDKPEEVHSGDNPSTPWRMAFEAAERDFPERLMELVKENRDEDGAMQVYGQKWFGLALDSVVAELRILPGAKTIFGKVVNTRSVSKGKKKPEGGKTLLPVPATTEKAEKVSRKKKTGEASHPDTVEITTKTPDKPMRGKKRKNSITSVMEDDVPLAVLAAGRAIGVVNRCPNCGLTSVFCPLTGERHAIDGEVPQTSTVPGKKTRRKEKDATTSKDGDKVQQQFSRKRERVDDTTKGGTSTTVASGDLTGKSVTRRKTSKSSGEGQSTSTATTTTNQPKKRKIKLEAGKPAAVSTDPDDVPLIVRLMERNAKAMAEASKPPPPPPPASLWRPPLAASESNKALQVLQRVIRGEKTAHVPFASMLHLPQVAVAKTSVVKKKNKKNNADPFGDLLEGDAGNDMGEDVAAAGAGAGEGGSSSGTVSKQGKNKKSDDEKVRHPLDITDVVTSISGKRYVKFMQLYTSERVKIDLLKKANDVPAVPRTRGAMKTTETGEEMDSSNLPSAPPPAEMESVKKE